MALTTITSGGLGDNSVDTDQLAASAVETAKINNDAVTLAKMASGTDGAMLTYDADGNPVAITGTDGQVATSAGADAVSAFEAAGGGNKTVMLPPLVGHNCAVTTIGDGGVAVRMLGDQYSTVGTVWGVPSDFSSLTSLKMFVLSHNTGNLYLNIRTQAVEAGEQPYDGLADEFDAIAFTDEGFGVTHNETHFLDVTDAMDGLTLVSGNDQWVGIHVRRDATHNDDTQNDNLDIMGFEVIYS